MIVKTLHKTAWLVTGCVFLLLAVIGLLLPIIPQLPFFLIAILCFMRASTRFTIWMHRQHWFQRIKARFPHRRR